MSLPNESASMKYASRLSKKKKARFCLEETKSQNTFSSKPFLDLPWKYNRAKSKASIASVVSIFWSALAFYQNEEIKKYYSFQNKLMSNLNLKNCQQSWSLISAAQKYILKLELIFTCIASWTAVCLFTADSPQRYFSELIMSSAAGLPNENRKLNVWFLFFFFFRLNMSIGLCWKVKHAISGFWFRIETA